MRHTLILLNPAHAVLQRDPWVVPVLSRYIRIKGWQLQVNTGFKILRKSVLEYEALFRVGLKHEVGLPCYLAKRWLIYQSKLVNLRIGCSRCTHYIKVCKREKTKKMQATLSMTIPSCNEGEKIKKLKTWYQTIARYRKLT